MILAPTYQGQHNYAKYEAIKTEIRNFLTHSETILDLDFLHNEEIRPYLFEIFGPEFVQHDNKTITLQSNNRRRLRNARKILKQLALRTYDIFMFTGKYRMKVSV